MINKMISKRVEIDYFDDVKEYLSLKMIIVSM